MIVLRKGYIMKTPKKPLYSRTLVSQEFQRKTEAESWAKKQRKTYKQADLSVKYDISRTPNSGWKATLFGKV
jgi:hypothetical protein